MTDIINKTNDDELKEAKTNLFKREKSKKFEVTQAINDIVNPSMKTFQDNLKVKEMVNILYPGNNKEITRSFLCK